MTNERKLETKSKSSWLNKAEQVLLWLSLFLLPWQLRHTFLFGEINGGYFEYGSWHLYAVDIVILLLLGLWFMRQKKPIDIGPKIIAWPLIAFVMWSLLSVWWAIDKPVAAMAAAHLLLFWGWYLYLINEVKHLRQILWPLLWGVALQAAWGMTQFMLNSSLGLNWLGESVLNPTQLGISVVESEGARQLRAHGMLPHANIFGGWLVIIFPILLYWFNKTKNIPLDKMLVAALGLLTMGVALSFARGAWLVLLLTIVGAAILYLATKSFKKFWLVVMLAVVFVFMLATQYQYVLNRFDLGERMEKISVAERIEGINYWQDIFGKYTAKGVGIGNYTFGLQEVDSSQPSWWYQPVHNIYLLISGELGTIGVAIWLWLVAVVVFIKCSLWRRNKELVLFSMPIISILLLGLVDHWLISLQQGRLLIFLALALLIFGYRLSLKRA